MCNDTVVHAEKEVRVVGPAGLLASRAVREARLEGRRACPRAARGRPPLPRALLGRWVRHRARWSRRAERCWATTSMDVGGGLGPTQPPRVVCVRVCDAGRKRVRRELRFVRNEVPALLR